MKLWKVNARSREETDRLQRETGLPSVLARLLAARGFRSRDEVESFFEGDGGGFEPLRFLDMDKAVERIRRALDGFERIAVYGDYDADGVTATAVLYSYLESCGANVMYYIPDREGEGYGMNCRALDVLHGYEVQLVITVDNGVSSLEEVEYAASLGMDVVVTDHHQPRAQLPAACAVVDPHRPGCGSRFKDLSGVGVAFQLVMALEGEDCDVQGLLENYADLVCIGTIGDVVPLTGENRIFVREGLRLLSQTDRLGVQALLERAGMEGRPLTAVNVAFTLVPRINATGRIGAPDRAVRLLVSEFPEEAEELAEDICRDNDIRRQIESEIYESALEQLRREPERLRERVLVVEGKDWHHGVIGIVASRLTDRFGKPSFVISCTGEEARASGRSVEGFHLFEAVLSCEGLLTRFGGHPMAAGLSLPTENVGRFRQAVNQWAAARAPVFPQLAVDCPLAPGELTLEVPRAMALLEPYGTGNPPPLFGLFGAALADVTPVGGGRHLRLTVKKDGYSIRCMRFGATLEEFAYRPGDLLDLALTLEEREYLGAPSLSVSVKELRPAGVDEKALLESRAAWETARLGGRLSPQARQALLPSREDFALVYRFLREGNGFSGGAECLWLRLGGRLPLGKILLCLEVLAEHSLVRAEFSGDFCRAVLLPAAGKVNLFDSNILRRISAAEREEGA